VTDFALVFCGIAFMQTNGGTTTFDPILIIVILGILAAVAGFFGDADFIAFG
jgi:hypothetical protein